MMQSSVVQTSGGGMTISQSMAGHNQPSTVQQQQQSQHVHSQQSHVIPNQGPVIIPVPDNTNTTAERYMHRAALGLAITQLTVGVLCISMHIMAIVTKSALASIGYGFWNGVFFAITGAIGVGAGCTKNSCTIIAHMVLSIVSASIFVPSLIISASVDLVITKGDYYWSNDKAAVAAAAIILAMGLLEFVIDIIAAVVGCHAVCCCNGSRGRVIWPAPTTYGQQPQVIYLQNPTMTGGFNGVMYVQQYPQYGAQPYVQQQQSPVPQPPAYGTDQAPPTYNQSAASSYQSPMYHDTIPNQKY